MQILILKPNIKIYAISWFIRGNMSLKKLAHVYSLLYKSETQGEISTKTGAHNVGRNTSRTTSSG